jgi:DNA (cytosine-5)-methyltransferase 3A
MHHRKENQMNIFGTYDGISCGQVAAKKAGVKIDKYYASEIEKHAIAITQYNHPDTIQVGNMYGVDYSTVKDIDIVLGGSPCTHWSVAKKDREISTEGLGFELFMKYVGAVRTLKPKYFLYENNYSIHKDIQKAISRELSVEPIFVNSASVSAQNRKRLYWTNIPVVGLPEDRGIYLKDILESGVTDREKSYCINASYWKSGNLKSYFSKHRRQLVFDSPNQIGYIKQNHRGSRIYSKNGKSVTLCASGGGWGMKTGLYKDGLNFRMLTSIECERLQTLPDDYTRYGLYDGVVKEVAKTNRLKCIGNGWTAEVIVWFLGFAKGGSIGD